MAGRSPESASSSATLSVIVSKFTHREDCAFEASVQDARGCRSHLETKPITEEQTRQMNQLKANLFKPNMAFWFASPGKGYNVEGTVRGCLINTKLPPERKPSLEGEDVVLCVTFSSS